MPSAANWLLQSVLAGRLVLAMMGGRASARIRLPTPQPESFPMHTYLLLSDGARRLVLVREGSASSTIQWSHQQLLDQGMHAVKTIVAASWLDARAQVAW
jgi:hypothetical protein